MTLMSTSTGSDRSAGESFSGPAPSDQIGSDNPTDENLVSSEAEV